MSREKPVAKRLEPQDIVALYPCPQTGSHPGPHYVPILDRDVLGGWWCDGAGRLATWVTSAEEDEPDENEHRLEWVLVAVLAALLVGVFIAYVLSLAAADPGPVAAVCDTYEAFRG